VSQYLADRRLGGNNNSAEHIDGISWNTAPVPRWWHRCWAQTRGTVAGWHLQRCACGAIRWSGTDNWEDRNSRRKVFARPTDWPWWS
jgi:hypothetical protein